MEAEANKSIPLLLRDRLAGTFAWLAHELVPLFESQGGIADRNTLKIGFDQRIGEGYAACIIHAPIVQSGTPHPIPPAYCKF